MSGKATQQTVNDSYLWEKNYPLLLVHRNHQDELLRDSCVQASPSKILISVYYYFTHF